MKCPYCGKTTPDYQSRCIYCGRPLPASKGKKTTPLNSKDVRLILILAASLAVVLLILIFSPVRDMFLLPGENPDASASASTQAAASADSGNEPPAGEAQEEEEIVDPGGLAGTEPADEEEQVEEEIPEVKDNAATILDTGKLEEIMATAGSDAIYSVCIADLNSGDYTGVNHKIAVSASAMVDIPILYAAAYFIDRGDLSLSTGITFHYSVGGRGHLKSSDDGRSISLEELLRSMLQYSDNNATNTLLDYFGKDTIAQVCNNEGFSSVEINGRIMETKDNTASDNYISAQDLCGMIFNLYSGRFQSIGKDFLYGNMQLKDSTADSGLCNYIGCDYYNLNGVKEYKYNEVAIIDNGKTPYVIAYLTNDVKREDLEDVASTLGQYVNQRVDSIN